MIHKIAGLPGRLTLSVTSNLILSLNSLWLPITSNNIALPSAQHVTSSASCLIYAKPLRHPFRAFIEYCKAPGFSIVVTPFQVYVV